MRWQGQRLELLAASIQGSGRFTHVKAWEVGEDLKSFISCNVNVKEGDSFPDIISNTADTYYVAATDTWNYMFDDSITSTNTVLKERAESLPDWYVIVSGRQTAGRGRIGRSFYSPEATGIYLSVLLRPDLPAEQSVRITTAAAVAACRAIEETTDRTPGIK